MRRRSGGPARALAEAEVVVFSLGAQRRSTGDAATYAATYRDAFEALAEVLLPLQAFRQIAYSDVPAPQLGSLALLQPPQQRQAAAILQPAVIDAGGSVWSPG